MLRRIYRPMINRVSPIILSRDTLKRQLKNLTDHYIAISDLISAHYPEDGKKEAIIFIAQMYIGACYETIKSEPFLGESIINQLKMNHVFIFFRYCRNAAFHGNKFDFRKFDRKKKILIVPKNVKVGEWLNYKITIKDQGKYLFEDKIKIGNTISLLEDVQKLF